MWREKIVWDRQLFLTSETKIYFVSKNTIHILKGFEDMIERFRSDKERNQLLCLSGTKGISIHPAFHFP